MLIATSMKQKLNGLLFLMTQEEILVTMTGDWSYLRPQEIYQVQQVLGQKKLQITLLLIFLKIQQN